MDNEEDSWSIEVQPDGELVKKQLKNSANSLQQQKYATAI